jgi:ABC-type multidrug transport system ATPase subunit
MAPGEISVDGVARRFRVHARETRTLKDLFVQRGHSGGEDIWALRDVSLAVARGEAVGLIGRNGSGKTTLLRVIAGIIWADDRPRGAEDGSVLSSSAQASTSTSPGARTSSSTGRFRV